MFPIISNAPSALLVCLLFGGCLPVVYRQSLGEYGDGRGMGAGEHRIKGNPAFTGDMALADYFLFQHVAGPCKWPRSFTFASHSGLSNGPQRKEMVSDRQPGPPKAGVRVYTSPPSAQALQLLGTDSRSLRDAHIISCLKLINTHRRNRHSRA